MFESELAIYGTLQAGGTALTTSFPTATTAGVATFRTVGAIGAAYTLARMGTDQEFAEEILASSGPNPGDVIDFR